MTWLNDWIIEHVPSYKLALKHADPRTKDWFLLWRDPIPAIILTVIYLLIVLLGPRYMRHREAFHIPTVILFTYNMALVVLSAYIVEEVNILIKNFLYLFICFLYKVVVGVYRSQYNVFCQRMIVSYDKNEMKITNALWYYYFSKVIEFLDTIFMIVRKRYTQITFLHVFHHATMFIIWWIVMTWLPVRKSILLFFKFLFISEWSSMAWTSI
jgi:hypothetical protein